MPAGRGSRSSLTASSAEAFEERAKCLDNQYSDMVAVSANNTPLGHVNGTLTIGENIADNGDVSLALDAYHPWATNNGATVNAGGVEVDKVDQLFFMSCGQIWCNQIRDEAQKQLLDIDPHAPGQARVNGAVMNSEAFARAFQCPAGSKMNPKKKCQLW